MRIQWRGDILEFEHVEGETVPELASRCADLIGADVTRISLFVLPKPGLMKASFPGPSSLRYNHTCHENQARWCSEKGDRYHG